MDNDIGAFSHLVNMVRGYSNAPEITQKELKAVYDGKVIVPVLTFEASRAGASMRISVPGGNPAHLPGVATQIWTPGTGSALDVPGMAANILDDLVTRGLDITGWKKN